MKPYRVLLSFCCVASLSFSMYAQSTVNACPASSNPKAITKTIDLCDLVKTMGNSDRPITLRSPNRNKPYLLAKHADVHLKYKRGDQVAFTCNSGKENFVITSFERVNDPANGSLQDSAPPSFPFCADFQNVIGKTFQPGTTVYSGPPQKSAIGQWYKFSFTVGKQSVDPHLVVDQ